jgi:hypothetical protein
MHRNPVYHFYEDKEVILFFPVFGAKGFMQVMSIKLSEEGTTIDFSPS